MRPSTVARPAPALVVASLALLIGVGASADAKPRVFSGAAIRRSSIPGNRVKPNALTGIQINEAKLGLVPVAKLSHFAELARSAETATSAKTAKAAETARTAEDARRLNGRDQTAFLSNTVRTVSAQTAEVPGGGGGAPAQISVSCTPEEKAIGGGAAWIIPGTNDPTALQGAVISASMPLPATDGVNAMTGWTAAGRNTTTTNRVLRVYAICVPENA
jgi:hypothetical protein